MEHPQEALFTSSGNTEEFHKFLIEKVYKTKSNSVGEESDSSDNEQSDKDSLKMGKMKRNKWKSAWDLTDKERSKRRLKKLRQKTDKFGHSLLDLMHFSANSVQDITAQSSDETKAALEYLPQQQVR